MSKVALITGVTGQDGAYLAALLLSKGYRVHGSYLTEYLLELGYEVHGIKRRSSLFNTDRIDHLYQDPHEKNVKFKLHYGDMTDSSNLSRIVQEVQPDEVYNLAAQSHVKVSFETPEYTANSDAMGTLRILEAIRILGLEKKTKFYQASTSELYGKVQEIPQSETTPFYPRSPYGVAKLYAFWIVKNYREAYGMYACNGILFNHESPLRGETFVTRKITRAAARIKLGLQDTVYLGNLDAKRDWGHARDYVEGMWLIEIEWKGKGVDEVGINKANGKEIVKVDPKYFRPTEVDLLIGDPTKAQKELGWKATFGVDELVKDMVRADLALFQRDKYLLEGGHKVYQQHE